MYRWTLALVLSLFQITSFNCHADVVSETLDIRSNFSLKVSNPILTEYVFTEGSNKPKFEPWGVAIFTVADLDQDKCDDVVLEWSDSLSPIQIFYGNETGILKQESPFEPDVRVRSIRQFKFADLNQDDVLDIVGFTAPHGWKNKELGNLWDADEPEFIAISKNARTYHVVENNHETYSHTGLLADTDNDSAIDIIQITEVPAVGFELSFDQNFVKKLSVSESFRLREYAVFDSKNADLNGDGYVDTVLTISKSYRQHPLVSPSDASKLGTLSIYLGKPNTPLRQIKPTITGQHWMSELLWKQFLSTKSPDAKARAYAGTSNVELLDLDHDGDLDILVGYFVQANSHWVTSGVQVLKNDSGVFIDKTSELIPNQPANRSLSRPTDLLYTATQADLNNDGESDLILALRSLDSMTGRRFSSVFYLFKNGQYVPVKNDEKLLGDAQKMQLIQAGDFNCDGKRDLVGLFAGIPDKENHYLKTLIAN